MHNNREIIPNDYFATLSIIIQEFYSIRFKDPLFTRFSDFDYYRYLEYHKYETRGFSQYHNRKSVIIKRYRSQKLLGFSTKS